jgi:hypothetical protein
MVKEVALLAAPEAKLEADNQSHPARSATHQGQEVHVSIAFPPNLRTLECHFAEKTSLPPLRS